jgi:hypothetical protein
LKKLAQHWWSHLVGVDHWPWLSGLAGATGALCIKIQQVMEAAHKCWRVIKMTRQQYGLLPEACWMDGWHGE